MADTPGPSDKPAPDLNAAQAALDEIRHPLNESCAAHGHMTAVLLAAGKAQKRATDALDGILSASLDTPLNAPFTPPEHSGDHRREHRAGRPRKLDSDPELRAFVNARIDHMAFSEVAAAVAGHFPPDRRVGKSAIHDWWKRRR